MGIPIEILCDVLFNNPRLDLCAAFIGIFVQAMD
jgi:hypothetical protein